MSHSVKRVEKYNIKNGVIGLNKYCCMILTKYFKDNNDIIEVFIVFMEFNDI
jgi:hypothetical protein